MENNRMSMETIFDHDVTEKELIRFVGKELASKIHLYKDLMYQNEDDANYALGLLYSMRGDKKKSDEYFAKVKNVELLKAFVQDC